MRSSPWRLGSRAGWLVLALALVAPGVGLAEKKDKTGTVKEQLKFGVKMAQRGLWREALFRFEQAQRLEPQNSEVLNNVAVAHEALGLFDEALALYRQALEQDPNNRALRRNYARFVEFYQAYKPRETPEEGAAEEPGAEAPETAEGDGDPPGESESGESESGETGGGPVG